MEPPSSSPDSRKLQLSLYSEGVLRLYQLTHHGVTQ